tara:strand:+ start:346 stop:558 length:213 start_codon:yes stop_codon:yes gene_type:complete
MYDMGLVIHMDWLITLFYLPAYLIGWGISIIIWYFILSFAYKALVDLYDLYKYYRKDKKKDHLDDVDNYY